MRRLCSGRWPSASVNAWSGRPSRKHGARPSGLVRRTKRSKRTNPPGPRRRGRVRLHQLEQQPRRAGHREPVGGKRWTVSVLAYVLKHGPVPDGFHVCHSCDNPRCIEQDHLWAGTQADNLRDMANKGRHGAQKNPMAWAERLAPYRSKPGERNPGARVTAATVADIRKLREGGATYGALVRFSGLSKTQVARIVTGESWAIS